MTQPFKSQFIPSSLLTANAVLITGMISLVGFFISRVDDILHMLARLGLDPHSVATQAIQQLIQF